MKNEEFKMISRLAMRGDCAAQSQLGEIYDFGISVKCDEEKAFK